MSASPKHPDVCFSVGRQDCSVPFGTDELQVVADVFAAAAEALRSGKHGTILGGRRGQIAMVGIDRGEDFPFDEEGDGLPILQTIVVRRTAKGRGPTANGKGLRHADGN